MLTTVQGMMHHHAVIQIHIWATPTILLEFMFTQIANWINVP